jgi:hypothetical protein
LLIQLPGVSLDQVFFFRAAFQRFQIFAHPLLVFKNGGRFLLAGGNLRVYCAV